MFPKRIFPCALVAACLGLSLLTSRASAQAPDSRPRQVAPATVTSNVSRLENDLIIISLAAEPSEARPAHLAPAPRFHQVLMAAIDARLDAPYVYGAAGPRAFDCSGFVWSVFQSAGINFERTSARSLWTRFAPARPEEEHKFGTLVFFNNLKHVGIVADEHGFYHASLSQGVVYSPFNDYWLSRLDGFRRVPLPEEMTE